MPTPTASEIDSFVTNTRAQLDLLARDLTQPIEVQRRAREARREIIRDKLRAAITDFNTATEEFVRITKALLEITEEARKNPVGDAVGMLTPTIRRAGELLTTIAQTPTESAVSAVEESLASSIPVPDNGHIPPATLDQPPPKGTATDSTKYSVIADEYLAMFEAAQSDPAKAQVVDNMRRRLVLHRAEYESIGRALSIPWHFVGLIHAMESNFNFAGHLHNGDSLAHRTIREPKRLPKQPDPPYAWSTSAIDALKHHNLQLVENWSLSRQLYELERFNGFGYRFRGMATPYLWSFSDRYVTGKFVGDGVFDRDAVSEQVGAAVILRALIEAGDINRPTP